VKDNIKKSLLFIGLTFLINWLIAAVFFFSGGRWNTPNSVIVGVIYMFVPMAVAIFIQKIIYKEALKESLGISFKFNRWFLAAWFIPPVLAFLTLGISLLLPGVEYSPEMEGMYERFRSVVAPEQLEKIKNQVDTMPIHPIWLGLLQGLLAGISINAIAGFGEELGWRGFLQKQFGYMGFWKSSILIGAVWGIWHAPIILQGHNYYQHPAIGVFMMTIWCILLGPIFSYVRLKAKSVIAAAVMHGSLNGTAGLAIIVVKGGNDLLIGITGLAGIIVLILTNIALFLYDSLLAKESAIMKKPRILENPQNIQQI
jgi:membrane protease YdiL (CAAX protease family)